MQSIATPLQTQPAANVSFPVSGSPSSHGSPTPRGANTWSVLLRLLVTKTWALPNPTDQGLLSVPVEPMEVGSAGSVMSNTSRALPLRWAMKQRPPVIASAPGLFPVVAAPARTGLPGVVRLNT